MELKSTFFSPVPACGTRSNRTFMELKFDMDWRNLGTAGSNRTFMELKCNKRLGSIIYTLSVLIVPLWN